MNFEPFKWLVILGVIIYFGFLIEECTWMKEMWPEVEMDILFTN
jgi:hypothetical protein